MSFITYSILLTSLLLGLLVSLNVRAEEGNSTYNFYFQKAPGPVTVNQGGAPAAPTQLVPTAPAAVPVKEVPVTAPAATSVAPAEEVSTTKKFHLSLGYALNAPFYQPNRYENISMEKPEYLSGQFAIKGEYEIADRLSVTGELYKLKREVGLTHGQPYSSANRTVAMDNQLPASQKKSVKTVIDYSIGAAYNIVRLRSTTFSLLGGLMTVPFIKYENTLPSGPNGYAVPVSVDHEKNLFLGARLRLIADNVWGLDLSYKYLTAAQMGVAQLGLTFAI